MIDSIKGLGTALVTPFTDTFEVDMDALRRLVAMQIAGGADYLVVLGTTGEAVTMTADERQKVANSIIVQNNGRLPLVLGLGGNCTSDVVRQLTEQSEWIGKHFAAILSVCPYYNKPSQEGLYQHFVEVGKASPVPVILYNVPGRTGVNLLPETAIRIYEACPEKVAGIKEASGNMEQIKHLIALSNQQTDGNLLVISGDDGLAAAIMQAGGAGLISVAANAFPHIFRQIVHQADSKLQARTEELVHLLFKEGNPAGIKTVLSQMGLICNRLRLPLVPNSESVQHEIAVLLSNLNF
ncbi:MAG: 4-hydroxy-tetrahydrodipicolinate synthase [Paludibacteraceae bacterium]|nr:4-hydroxy-tetrahydrodipicolinate synthase [Paludibacteraceae bacterium]